LERYGIGADGHAGELVRPAFGGGRHERLLEPGARDGDGDARQHAAGRVRDFPEDRAERLGLGDGRARGPDGEAAHRERRRVEPTCHVVSSSRLWETVEKCYRSRAGSSTVGVCKSFIYKALDKRTPPENSTRP